MNDFNLTSESCYIRSVFKDTNVQFGLQRTTDREEGTDEVPPMSTATKGVPSSGS